MVPWPCNTWLTAQRLHWQAQPKQKDDGYTANCLRHFLTYTHIPYESHKTHTRAHAHTHTDIWAESFSTKLRWSSNTKFNLAQFWLLVHAFVGVALLSHDITSTTALGPSSKEKLALTNDLKPALPSTQYLSLWKEDKGSWGEGESAVPALLCCADWDKTNRLHCTEGS